MGSPINGKTYNVGDTAGGRAVGQNRTGRFIFQACVVCGKVRWVRFNGGRVQCEQCVDCSRKASKGVRDKNPHWKGGEVVSLGYVLVHQPEHPQANHGYVRRSHLVIETALGKVLPTNMVVHHLNGIKDDDRLENLVVLTPHEHSSLHCALRRKATCPRGHYFDAINTYYYASGKRACRACNRVYKLKRKANHVTIS